MTYTYEDITKLIPVLKRYIRSKIHTDLWQDIMQDTLLYLYLKFDTIIVTNLVGLLFNTANFFINKHYKKQEHLNIDEIVYLKQDNTKFVFDTWNGYEINDKLYQNLKTISKKYLVPFEMQLSDKSLQEISVELGLNINTVKTRISRAKVYLAK